MPSIIYLMLRSARRARLEARTTLLQLRCDRVEQFPDSLESRDPYFRRPRRGKVDPGFREGSAQHGLP
jgi:hypothetical protein